MERNEEGVAERAGGGPGASAEETRRIGPARTLVIHSPKAVTQAELAEAAALQRAAWAAEEAAHRAVRRIGRRFVAGAKVEPGRFEYDAEGHMVRTRKEEKVG